MIRFSSISGGVLGVIVVLCSVAASLLLGASPDAASYRASVGKWRQMREASLKADYGWLSVSGLFWLHQGENKFGSDPLGDIVLPSSAPPDAGTFVFDSTPAAPSCT